MPKLTLDKLEPGMITAKPVVNNGGMVLLGDNTELTADLIDRIKNMDVEGVFVQGSSKPSVPRETALSELDSRFRNVGDNPLMDIIKRAAREHIEGLYE